MLLLAHEFQFLLRTSEAVDGVQIRSDDAITARVLCRHRLASRTGDRLTVTEHGRWVVEQGVEKPGRMQMYVEVPEAASSPSGRTGKERPWVGQTAGLPG